MIIPDPYMIDNQAKNMLVFLQREKLLKVDEIMGLSLTRRSYSDELSVGFTEQPKSVRRAREG